MRLPGWLLLVVATGCSSTPSTPAATSGAAGVAGAGGGSGGQGGSSGQAGTSAGGASSGGQAGQGGTGGTPPMKTDSSKRLVAHPLGSTPAPNGFYEYLPPGYGEGQSPPLVVFWHGLGEHGDGVGDLEKVLEQGLPRVIASDHWPAERPFVVLAPQATGCVSSAGVQAFLSWAIEAYGADKQRVYLTGLSCGAIGSWQYLRDHLDEQVAAAVLMSGNPGAVDQPGSAWDKRGCELGRVALWVLHGDQDTTVSIKNEQDTMEKLIACPQPPRRDAKFTVIAGGEHEIWTPLYDGSAGHDLFGFLLANPHP